MQHRNQAIKANEDVAISQYPQARGDHYEILITLQEERELEEAIDYEVDNCNVAMDEVPADTGAAGSIRKDAILGTVRPYEARILPYIHATIRNLPPRDHPKDRDQRS